MASYTLLGSSDAEADFNSSHSNSNHNETSPTEPPCSSTTPEQRSSIWPLKTLIPLYALIWLTYFVQGVLSSTAALLSPYITSTLASHSLTPTINILSSVIGGITNLTLARILDVLGRPQGYLLCIVLATAGLVLMATCKGIGGYAAAQVFQTVGNNGIMYALAVVVADISALRDRGLVQALVTSPALVAGWLGGVVAGGFLKEEKGKGVTDSGTSAGWRVAFAGFAVVIPGVTLPLFALLLWHQRKNASPPSFSFSSLPTSRSFLEHIRDFDAPGLILLSTALALLLLPLNLSTQTDQPISVTFTLLACGIFLLIAFIIWERHYAPTTFIPYALLTERTILGSCLLCTALFASYWAWNSFFSSYLQVVTDLSIKQAGYVVQLYTVCSVLGSLGAGVLIRRWGRPRGICLILAMPMCFVGTVLFAYSTAPTSAFTSTSDSSSGGERNRISRIGLITGSQIFSSTATGAIMICAEVAAMSSSSPTASSTLSETSTSTNIATILAVLGIFASTGAALGLSIASTIWQRTFRPQLAIYLPAEEQGNLAVIVADLKRQLGYPVGSVVRGAIAKAYADVQGELVGVALGVLVLGVVGLVLWRDVDVKGAD
ncbi:major facilitator superfamily domain-containing protein [Aspergillus foveolatus]|uniref:major facilitator superfamily domain-containing protein n=1 Tax=Aspergillus foveolatus TaxID=210207 RepID=UPI003CCDA650